ncbi:efflux transporter, RND family, MFP subunit [Candidatus Endolissoclinum faulkneri L2]|uniref:Efflux transporter, RND family, MFP subunit n=1 Tax=Candidatus Endolissoclinum faulkneri L2 TaxID=1193729 RepID=K7YHI2_9PROT|nr:efflux RND transporter periplasmic adaptor subunit [Candidatus Endolissoclinum faulkneri]AFX99020.1 efflux transporter, RND family, MFP subunit [Candidatus Endolissoclinum faulkneri L2]
MVGKIRINFILWSFLIVLALVSFLTALNWELIQDQITKVDVKTNSSKMSSSISGEISRIPVRTATVKTGYIAERLRAVGNLYSERKIDVRSPNSGFLVALPVADGSHVRMGDVLMELDSEMAAAMLLASRTQLQFDQQNYNRLKALVEKGYGARKSLQTAEAKLAASHAEVIRNERLLNDRKVVAPFDGVIGQIYYSVGAFVTSGEVITKLWNDSYLYVDVRISESYAKRIHMGMEFDVENGITNEVLNNGVVKFISSDIDPVTRSVLVRGLIPNYDRTLRAGLFIAMSLTMKQKSEAIIIPRDALVFALGGTFVFKVVDGTAQRVQVNVGIEQDNMVEIVQGLAPDDLVITDGRFSVLHGAPVSLVKS